MSLSRSSRPKLAPCAVAADDATASNTNSGASRDVVIARVRVVETIGGPRRFSGLWKPSFVRVMSRARRRSASLTDQGESSDLPVGSPAALTLQHGASHGAARCHGRGGGGVPGASRRRTRARVRGSVGRGTPGVALPVVAGVRFRGKREGSRGVHVARAGAGDEGASGTDAGGSGYVLPPTPFHPRQPFARRSSQPLSDLSLTRLPPPHLVSPPPQAVGTPSPRETTAADAAASSVGSLASSRTRRRPFHSSDGPPTVSSTIEPGSPSSSTPSSSPSPSSRSRPSWAAPTSWPRACTSW